MATSRKAAERPWSANEEERSKALGAALEAGDPVILFDNVVTPLEGAAFAGAITESNFKDRRLGSNSGKDQIVAPTNALMLATGNHSSRKATWRKAGPGDAHRAGPRARRTHTSP